jgi:hypothetical protein
MVTAVWYVVGTTGAGISAPLLLDAVVPRRSQCAFSENGFLPTFLDCNENQRHLPRSWQLGVWRGYHVGAMTGRWPSWTCRLFSTRRRAEASNASPRLSLAILALSVPNMALLASFR